MNDEFELGEVESGEKEGKGNSDGKNKTSAKSTDRVLELVGNNNRYQYVMVLLLFLISLSLELGYIGVPIMETSPIVEFINENGSKEKTLANYTICTKYNFTVLLNESKSTWITDYDIFCDKLKVSLLGTLMCLGGLTGTILVQVLRKLGARKGLIISCFINVFGVLTLQIKTLFFLYLANFLMGMSNIMSFVLRLNIMSEITGKQNRAFFNNFIISGGGVCVIIIYLIFENNYHWRVIYLSSLVLLLITTSLFFYLTVENFRFYFIKGDYAKMIESALYIARFNGKENSLQLEDEFKAIIGGNVHFGEFEVEEKEKKIQLNDKDLEGNKRELQLVNPYKDANTVSLSSDEISKDSSKTMNDRKSEEELAITTAENATFKKVNFIVCLGIQNFALFLNTIQIKKFSYEINIYFYVYLVFYLLVSYSMSFVMNFSFFGRRISKLILISLFIICNFFEMHVISDKKVAFQVFNFGRLFIHMSAMTYHTHLNESFNTIDRLSVHAWAFSLGKFTAALAPFVLEYLSKDAFYVLLLSSVCLFILYWFQKETLNKTMIDK